MFVNEAQLRKIVRKVLISEAKANFAQNIKNKKSGDEFRAWVNLDKDRKNKLKTIYKNKKKKDDKLDVRGSHTNSYIKIAWDEFGDVYLKKNTSPNNKKVNPKEAANKKKSREAIAAGLSAQITSYTNLVKPHIKDLQIGLDEFVKNIILKDYTGIDRMLDHDRSIVANSTEFGSVVLSEDAEKVINAIAHKWFVEKGRRLIVQDKSLKGNMAYSPIYFYVNDTKQLKEISPSLANVLEDIQKVKTDQDEISLNITPSSLRHFFKFKIINKAKKQNKALAKDVQVKDSTAKPKKKFNNLSSLAGRKTYYKDGNVMWGFTRFIFGDRTTYQISRFKKVPKRVSSVDSTFGASTPDGHLIIISEDPQNNRLFKKEGGRTTKRGRWFAFGPGDKEYDDSIYNKDELTFANLKSVMDEESDS